MNCGARCNKKRSPFPTPALYRVVRFPASCRPASVDALELLGQADPPLMLDVDKKTLKIAVEDGVLSIQGERTKESRRRARSVIGSEVRMKASLPSFNLPENYRRREADG